MPEIKEILGQELCRCCAVCERRRERAPCALFRNRGAKGLWQQQRARYSRSRSFREKRCVRATIGSIEKIAEGSIGRCGKAYPVEIRSHSTCFYANREGKSLDA